MPEHQPGLVENDEARTSVQALLDAAKQVGQDGNQVSLAHVHQLFNLKALEASKRKAIGFGIQKLSHRSVDCVVMEGILDFTHLDPADEVRQRAAGRGSH
ncbi:hypothetical protein D3C73_1074940 [compost metagenome]